VTFTVKSFVGTEFVFPSDWSPFLAVAIGFNLAPGESQVVRARWRAADVPAPHTHGCMLAHVWTPADGATPGAHTWTSNNLVQRNLTIVDVEPNEVADIHLRVGSRAGKGGVARLEVVRPARFPRLKVELASKIPGALAALRTPASTVTQPPAIVLTEPAVAQLVSGTATQSLTLRFAAGSRIGGSGMIKRPVDAPIEMFHDDGTEVVSFPDGKVGGWGARLKRGVAVDAILRIRAPSNLAAGELANVDVIQRDVTGNTIGGLRVCLRGRHGVTHRA
jgi:hypothetical protein